MCACRVQDAIAEREDAALLFPPKSSECSFSFLTGEPDSSSAQHTQVEASNQREERQTRAMKQVRQAGGLHARPMSQANICCMLTLESLKSAQDLLNELAYAFTRRLCAGPAVLKS